MDSITPDLIVEKFNKWITRTICSSLRKRRIVGKQVVDRINLQERPKDIYAVKLFIENLQVLLPDKDSISDPDPKWFHDIHKDLRKWSGVFETLTSDDYADIDVSAIAEHMIDNPDKIQELLDIMDSIQEK